MKTNPNIQLALQNACVECAERDNTKTLPEN